MLLLHRTCPSLALLALALTGCAQDIGPTNNGDASHDGAGDIAPSGDAADAHGLPPSSSRIKHSAAGPSVVRSQVNASDDVDWVYFDLESGSEVTVSDPLVDSGWDLAFRRFHIALDGGESGSGNAAALYLADAFDALTRAPAGGYESDAPDGDDADDLPDYFLSNTDDGWWDYDVSTHGLSARPRTYVVRTVEGNHFKLRFEDYYSNAGSSGYITLRWAPLSPP